MHGAGPTPTQIEANERSKRFREAIARRAAEISPEAKLRALTVAPPVPMPLPPIPNTVVADAVEFAFLASWKHEIRQIIEAVALESNLTMGDLLSSRRDKAVVLPRHIAMYLCKVMTLRSLPDIGRRFGGRDHTTVLHAVNKITRLVAKDAEFAARVEKIKASLA